jgi:hypothetical protein
MAYLINKNRHEGTTSNFAMFFAFIFIAIGVVAGAVLGRLETFRPLATKVQTVPRFVTRLKERIA